MTENITELRTKIENEISHRSSSKNFYDVLLTKTLQAKLSHLAEIEEILSYDKHKIVFIGTVGTGKTTAICHLFNLLVSPEREGNAGQLFDPKDDTNNHVEVAEILKTGVGYTTLCEVELQLSDGVSKIRIDPYTEEDLVDILSIFAEFIQYSISPDKDNPNSPGKQIMTPEVVKAIKSLINLKDVRQEVTERGRTITKTIDKCKEEFNKHDSIDVFKDQIIQRAKIHERTTTEIIYDEGFGNEKSWLKKIFEEINSARLGNFSLPKKIYISLNKDFISESLFDYFESIIDTKGLDANENRKDIDDYIKDKRTICVFTTKYTDAPDTNIRSLLEYHFKDKLANYQTKFVITVLSQKGQPEGEDGATNREEGCAIRLGIIQDILSSSGITEMPDFNINFFDSLRYYMKDVNKQNKVFYSPKDYKLIEDDRYAIVDNLLETIKARTGFYQGEFTKLEKDVNQIINGSGLSDEEERLISETYNKINNYSNLNLHNYRELTDKFIHYFKHNYAPMTIKAINRRYGLYRGIDIFYDAKKMSAESILRTVTKDFSEKIASILMSLRSEIANDDVGKLIDEINTQFQYLYKNFIEDISSEIYSFLHDEKLSKDEKGEFWDGVMGLKGRGYREDVGATFRYELETTNDSLPNANEYFKEITEDRWKEYVIAGVANYFTK